jgi:hypothetical protein
MLTAASCSHEATDSKPNLALAEAAPDGSGSNHGQLIDLGILQTASEIKRYSLELLREPNGELRLTFLVATDSGFQPATTLEGSVLTLLVTEKGKESWSAHFVELTRLPAGQSQHVVFLGRLPEVVRPLELTAVIPRLRIAGQRLHARFTMSIPAEGEE